MLTKTILHLGSDLDQDFPHITLPFPSFYLFYLVSEKVFSPILSVEETENISNLRSPIIKAFFVINHMEERNEFHSYMIPLFFFFVKILDSSVGFHCC